MAEERRNNQKLTKDDLYKHLNSKQLAGLRESAVFGWRVSFIRRPLFLEPIIVLHNSRDDRIGVLESDGRINLELDVDVRPKEPLKEQNNTKEATQKENRKGMPPIPIDYEDLLNPEQLKALRRIETFGWKLYCIRRTQLQQPIAIIISPEVERYATLEKDGRLELMTNSVIRKDSPTENNASVSVMPVTKGG